MTTTEQQIEEGNIEIDIFMGKSTKREVTPSCLYAEHLKYHSDWNLLMDVVEKINKVHQYTEMDGDTFLPGELIMQVIKEALSQVDINTVWEQVVQFLHWYSTQSKTTNP